MDQNRNSSAQWQELRDRMVEEQLRSRGIRDRRVLAAMAQIPRQDFLPERIRSAAYEDRAVPVDHGQTVSQPYIVAYMTEKLNTSPEQRVLEIGTGMGYQTAILALLSKYVYTVERIAALQETAVDNLRSYPNISFVVGDGSLGLRDHAPYDRIMVTAGAPAVPAALVDQLDDAGILVIPVGGAAEQTIVRIVREGGRTRETSMLACRFVKLVGQAGWSDEA